MAPAGKPGRGLQLTVGKHSFRRCKGSLKPGGIYLSADPRPVQADHACSQAEMSGSPAVSSARRAAPGFTANKRLSRGRMPRLMGPSALGNGYQPGNPGEGIGAAGAMPGDHRV
jgi:hypothetical protein